jgi:hypothetical protein
MKFLAIVAGIACVFVGTSFGSAASLGTQSHGSSTSWPRGYTSMMLPAIGSFKIRRVFLPQQAAGTATPTVTAVATPSPTSNPSYPDPVTLLQNSFGIFDQLNGLHFEYIIDGDQQGTDKVHIDAVGDANCKGPSLKAKVTGKESLVGTLQSKSSNFNLIQVKNAFYKKSKSTKNVWKKSTAAAAAPFTFPVDNPLACPNASTGSGSGSGSGSGATTPTTQIKDLRNLGPDSVTGVSVWHIQATEIDIDSTGAITQALLDLYVGQQHQLLYKYSATVHDTTNGINLVFQRVFGKFGEKVTIKAPKVGSAQP